MFMDMIAGCTVPECKRTIECRRQYVSAAPCLSTCSVLDATGEQHSKVVKGGDATQHCNKEVYVRVGSGVPKFVTSLQCRAPNLVLVFQVNAWSVKDDKPKLLKSQDVQVGAVLCLSVPQDLPQVTACIPMLLMCCCNRCIVSLVHYIAGLWVSRLTSSAVCAGSGGGGCKGRSHSLGHSSVPGASGLVRKPVESAAVVWEQM